MKRVLTSIALGALLLSAAPAVAGAAVPSSGEDDVTVTQIKDRLTSFGVDAATQQALIDGIKAGNFPDSDTGAEPVSESTVTRNGAQVTRYVYADGSVAEASIQVPKASGGGITTQAISGCSSTSGNQWKNCKVDYNAATWSGSYYQPVIAWAPGKGAQVTGTPFAIVQGGIGISGAGASVLNAGNRTASAQAWVRWQAAQKATIAGVPVNRTVGFDMKVTPTGGPSLSSFGG